MDKFTVMPNKISHSEKPAFEARWFSGEAKSPEESSQDSFFYEGSGENDRLLIYAIKWQGKTPNKELFDSVMNQAIGAIDNWISDQF